VTQKGAVSEHERQRIGCAELALHDWRNMPLTEQHQALADIRALAETHEGRRARALNVARSFFYFLTPGVDDGPEGG